MNNLELAGLKFGRLTVIDVAGRFGKRRLIYWRCQCECGKEVNVQSSVLKFSKTRSCGCLLVDFMKRPRKLLCGDGIVREISPPKTMANAENVLEYRSRPEDRGYKSLCRVWMGSQTGGYGCLRLAGKTRKTHVLSWMIHRGEVPLNMEVCHHCDQPDCINPDHLFLGTHKENMVDAGRKGRMGGSCGEEHHSARFNPEQVISLRRRFLTERPNRKMAVELGVTLNALQKIESRQSWKHI